MSLQVHRFLSVGTRTEKHSPLLAERLHLTTFTDKFNFYRISIQGPMVTLIVVIKPTKMGLKTFTS